MSFRLDDCCFSSTSFIQFDANIQIFLLLLKFLYNYLSSHLNYLTINSHCSYSILSHLIFFNCLWFVGHAHLNQLCISWLFYQLEIMTDLLGYYFFHNSAIYIFLHFIIFLYFNVKSLYFLFFAISQEILE